MTTATEVQTVSDSEGNAVAVIVPIDVWREIESERETAYLLSSKANKERLLAALARDGEGALSLEDARAQLGL
jgi:PHD/YefM family antitoxin component YafN of YafNO toxin-antitoxin module